MVRHCLQKRRSVDLALIGPPLVLQLAGRVQGAPECRAAAALQRHGVPPRAQRLGLHCSSAVVNAAPRCDRGGAAHGDDHCWCSCRGHGDGDGLVGRSSRGGRGGGGAAAVPVQGVQAREASEGGLLVLLREEEEGVGLRAPCRSSSCCCCCHSSVRGCSLLCAALLLVVGLLRWQGSRVIL